ncbi:MAG: DegQ family serine endoprotease [Roseibium album]|uniref:Putative periplasmic serine endoprotease DegP-like n=1 Tax=Roseibium album TaxID=311410 RepID=A0A0M6Z9H6_9HYPH|nr:DegQ family serine endoprotease [Roseibium album]MBG6148152.1 Do/DeqQ family serine protease [Labrenzia sp. EL_142]MBG6158323.1 Do/DeqQ family serine protease [Labrenzia sp. EL_162]MBG6166814.1 Do/DeqQ family serine protease [Labrenzia sp. EL_195]MBG6172900.1 Do/DeqQ family serine protease [Labrenzia sp. EL_132]MBG6196664.1 Do/DeqQ family serine protease [Labrenzia sp. EL_159]MBG6211630.1 Do/DeqQ family serine protease [Labrenzia sp. EL_126]MBG6226881.1 Do/DeqQ family serine protease [Lab
MRLANSNRFRPLCRILLATLTGLLATATFAQTVEPTPADLRLIPQNEAQIKLSFAPVVKQVAPAVVNVYASRKVVQRQRVSPFFEDPFFRRFFGQPGGSGRPRERVESSLGSGVIISADGTVITNHHVIKGADAVRVALSDRREFDADIVLMDERTDLAVLKIRGEGPYEHVSFANSDSLEVGDIVLAIGNPFGVGQTVTQGIVSALARTQVGVTDFQFFIQTDAAINPGNSGGALVDMTGKLVGINTAIFSRSGGSNGIGFAIPAHMARFVAQAADQGGKVRRPWLGATVQMVNAEIAEALSLERPRGVLVTAVFDDSPAHDAGLKVSDLVIAIEGKEVIDPNSFGYRFATKMIGETSEFLVVRGGQEIAIPVSLQPAPETVPRDARVLREYSPFEGATVMNLSPAVSEELGLEGLFEGVVIASVNRGSAANQVGMRPGDIIRVVNNQKVESTRMLETITKTPPRVWRLEVERDGKISKLELR